MITGNIGGIKKMILERLERLFDLKIDTSSIFSYELAKEMNEITRAINKEICVVISRRGKVTAISIGKFNTADIPYINVSKRTLCGYRVIHTHPSGNSTLSSMDTSALMDLKLDAMVAIGVNEIFENIKINIGFCDVYNNTLTYSECKNLSLQDALSIDLVDKLFYLDKIIGTIKQYADNEERAILVSNDSGKSLEELVGLTEACGVVPVYKILQRKIKVNSAYYTGQGKVQEISHLRQILNANVVIFDDELSGSQVRNLERAIKCKVIDRTTLILDIFARRAKTKEGILQVELAMLNYRLHRLRDANVNLARLKGGVGVKGGVGSRGPGEKKLESDRRHIERRIEEIRSELSAANRINKEPVLEADMLFATLDTTVRAVSLRDNRKIALSDTVGFISKLPHDLVEAFKSTLEEVVEADLLLHVVDASNEEAINQIKSVNLVLEELNAIKKNTVVVLNKVDKAEEENLKKVREFLKGGKMIEVSAVKEVNLYELLDLIGREIPSKLVEKEFIIPYTEQKIISMLHENSKVLQENYIEEGTHIKVLVEDGIYKKCRRFEVVPVS